MYIYFLDDPNKKKSILVAIKLMKFYSNKKLWTMQLFSVYINKIVMYFKLYFVIKIILT